MRIMLGAAVALAAGAAAAEPTLERGTYLVQGPMGCGNCHTPLGAMGPDPAQELAGRLVEKNPAYTAIAPNLTPAGEIKDWTDAQVIKAIREGIRPDGEVMGPPMPFELYNHLSDDDVGSVVMYLRQLKPVENDPGESVYNIPLPPAYGPPVTSNPPVPQEVSATYGAYLAGPIAHCVACHSPIGPMGPDYQNQLGAGGNVFQGPNGEVMSANITPTGIGEYTDEELDHIIRQGVKPDGSHISPPMPIWAYSKMTDDDVHAIILYLRSLPALPDGKPQQG